VSPWDDRRLGLVLSSERGVGQRSKTCLTETEEGVGGRIRGTRHGVVVGRMMAESLVIEGASCRREVVSEMMDEGSLNKE
jgi:hypothetical protein